MTNTCSEGTVTLTAGTIYILLLTGDAIAGAVNGSTTQSMSGPYYNANTAGCSSASGVISGTCTISLAATEYGLGVPAFTLH
jgi:hypothetical protein